MNKKIIIEDITRMKNLFVYKPGKVISEQITTSPEQQAIIDKGKKYTEITPTVSKTEVVPVQKTPEQIRQQSRYDQGIARQSRRNERRKGNMSQT